MGGFIDSAGKISWCLAWYCLFHGVACGWQVNQNDQSPGILQSNVSTFVAYDEIPGNKISKSEQIVQCPRYFAQLLSPPPFLLYTDIFSGIGIMSINITFISVSIYIGCTFLMSERLYPFIIYQCKMYANLYKSVTKHPSIDRESSYFEEISLDMGIVKIKGRG